VNNYCIFYRFELFKLSSKCIWLVINIIHVRKVYLDVVALVTVNVDLVVGSKLWIIKFILAMLLCIRGLRRLFVFLIIIHLCELWHWV